MKKKCPDCAEWVANEAIVCRHCQRRFTADEMASARMAPAKSRATAFLLVVGLAVLALLWSSQPGNMEKLVAWETSLGR